jgi:hypothetical protein
MEPNRIAVFRRLLLIFLGITACSILQPATPNPTTTSEPIITLTTTPTALLQPPATQELQTVTPLNTPTQYENTEYKFSFQIPAGWTLEEIVWEEMEGTTQAIVLTKDFFRIVLHFKTVFEDVFLGPRGMAQGELVKLDEISFFGREVGGHSLVFEGKTKMLMYGMNTNELRFFAGLDKEEYPDLDNTYEDVDIPQEIQIEFIALLETMTRTGTVTLPESVSLLADIPLILPLEKSYYSQIYDTDVANACGPASALMVLDYYGLEDSMGVVIDRLQSLPSPGAFDPGCYINTVCTSPDALSMLLYDYGLQVNPHEDWTLSEIFAVTAKGHPIIADILWDPSTESMGHFVVIYGVDLNQQVLYYHDPYRGREMTAHWDDFASLWEGKVDVGDPLKPEGHYFWGLEIGPQL